MPSCVRPTFKVLLFAYSVMHDQAPCYLAELLSCHDLRFAVAAAALWNGLPNSVRTAKTQPQYKNF